MLTDYLLTCKKHLQANWSRWIKGRKYIGSRIDVRKFGIRSMFGIVGIFCLFVFYIGYAWVTSAMYTVAGVPVLAYHLVDDHYDNTPLAVKVSHFEGQMKYLHDNGYHAITLDQLYKYVSTGSPLPQKPVVITFDDGYEDNYTNAFPILKKYNMKATVFMIADSIGAPRFLTADQLKEMNAYGFDVQSHTYSHRPLTTLDGEEIKAELSHSKVVLEEVLNKKIQYIAYPQGKYDKKVEELTREAGYKLAFTVGPGNYTREDGPMEITRMPIFESNDSYLGFRARLHVSQLVIVTNHLYRQALSHGWRTVAAFIPTF